MNLRLLVVDDQELVREGLSLILSAAEGMEVVGQARDGVEAVSLYGSLEPDVVLMDIRMPRMDGVTAMQRILAQHPEARVVMLTTYGSDEFVISALRSGASGYLLKDTPRAALADAVRAAATGELLIDREVARLLVNRTAGESAPPGVAAAARQLTGREWDVLELVAEGDSNAEIAERLILSEATVKTHVSRLLQKLQVRDRLQLVILVHRHRLSRR